MSYGIVIHEIEKIINELKLAVKETGTSKKIRMLSGHLSRLVDSYAELLRNKSKNYNNLVDIIKQALFSVEYRLSAHAIEVVDGYSNFSNDMRVNSIYWTTYAKKTKRKILIKLTEEIDGFVSIVIADNGLGFKISGEDAIKPFVSTKSDGLGLGLNIVNEIMLSQNGTIAFPESGDISLPSEFQNGAIVALAFKKENNNG